MLCVLFFAGCAPLSGTKVVSSPAPYNEVFYRFEKGIFLSQRFYLTVINHSEKMVTFFTDGQNNYLTLDDGKELPVVHPKSSWDFMDKGIFSIKPEEKASLSFDIPRNQMRQAVTITFKGQTEVENMVSMKYWTPDQQIIVTYQVRSAEFLVKVDKLPLQKKIWNGLIDKKNDPLGPIDSKEFKLRIVPRINL